MDFAWMRWAVGEGLTKTLSAIIQRSLGIWYNTVPYAYCFLFIIGTIQMLGGLCGAFMRRAPILGNTRHILGGVLFGIVASAMTIIGLVALQYPDAEIGVTTFLITLSIIPGVFADRLFGDRIAPRQGLGICVYLLSGWAILDFPNLEALMHLPAWVLLVMVNAALAVVNETIMRFTRGADPLANNFWVGATTIVCSAAGITAYGFWKFFWNLHAIALLSSLAIGGIVLVMISFKLMSYKDGGTIAFKKLVMQGTYLITAAVSGIIIFGEAASAGKALGILGFFAALVLTDKKVWAAIKGLA